MKYIPFAVQELCWPLLRVLLWRANFCNVEKGFFFTVPWECLKNDVKNR